MPVEIDTPRQSAKELGDEIVPSSFGKGDKIQLVFNRRIRSKPSFSQVFKTSAIPKDASHISS